MEAANIMSNNLRALLALSAVILLTGASGPPDTSVADAAMRDDLSAVRTLIAGGADVNAAQGDGMTALHWAADLGNAEIASGANLEAHTRIGDLTPLLIAAEAGAGPVVRTLLAAGADAEARSSVGGGTALH